MERASSVETIDLMAAPFFGSLPVSLRLSQDIIEQQAADLVAGQKREGAVRFARGNAQPVAVRVGGEAAVRSFAVG